MINPYYYPEKLGFELLAFDDPNAYYDYDTLCFFADKEGKVYTAHDSGCSCPTPFEDHYAAETVQECIQKLERIGSLEQAMRTLKSWPYVGANDERKLKDWLLPRLDVKRP